MTHPATRTGTDPRPGLAGGRWARVGLALVWATLGYNVIEAVVALWAGAAADSVALLGFGLDSVVESSASVLLLWRLRVEVRGASLDAVRAAEDRVHRFVGFTFFALAAWVTGQSAWSLLRSEAPAESTVGLALAAVSLVVMPLVAWGKLRAAREIGSAALRAEAKETLACAYLSLSLLLGLAANAALGWWWADPAAALLMVPWLVHEGREALEGEEARCD